MLVALITRATYVLLAATPPCSADRYFRHLFGIFRGATFACLVTPLTYLTGNAVLLGVYQTLVENRTDLLPPWLQHLPSLYLGDSPLELTSFALSLLMVFRTEASYARSVAMHAWVKGVPCMQACKGKECGLK